MSPWGLLPSVTCPPQQLLCCRQKPPCTWIWPTEHRDRKEWRSGGRSVLPARPAAPCSPFSSICDLPDLVEATTPAVAWLTPREACWSLARLALSLSAFTCRGREGVHAHAPPGPTIQAKDLACQLRPHCATRSPWSQQPCWEPQSTASGAVVFLPHRAQCSYLGSCHQLCGAGCNLMGTDHQLLKFPFPLHHQVSSIAAGGQRRAGASLGPALY